MRVYAPAIVLVIYALAVSAGADPIALLVPFLLIEAAAVFVYAEDVSRRLKHRDRRKQDRGR